MICRICVLVQFGFQSISVWVDSLEFYKKASEFQIWVGDTLDKVQFNCDTVLCGYSWPESWMQDKS